VPEVVPEPVEASALSMEVELHEPAAVPDAAEEGLDLDFESLQEAEEVPVSAIAADSVTVDGGPSEEIEEFLAEADFYIQQGLLDEAEFLYRKLSKLDPQNQEIIDRLRRFDEQKEASGEEKAEVEEAPLLSEDGISALESDLDRVLGDEAKSDKGLKVTVSGGESEEQTGEFSDFLSDLREELDTDVPSPEPVVTEDEGLSEIFQEFQEGLKEQLGEEDFETHYNLGIAYKEMGLMQEAVGEFELSEKSEVRKLDSISMIALCFRDMGRSGEAVAKLQEGLQCSPQGGDEQKGFLYDLADFFGKTGHEGESAEMFNRLHALDPGYRDVGERVQTLRGQAEAPPAAKKSDAKPVKNKKSKVSYL